MGGVALLRHEIAAGDVPAAVRRAGNAHLRHDLTARVAQPHALGGNQPRCLHPGEQVGGVQGRLVFIARQTHLCGAEPDHRDGHVDQADGQAVDVFAALAGREHLSGLGTDNVEEIHQHRGGGPGNAVDAGVAEVRPAPAGGLQHRFHQRAGVGVADGDARFRVTGRDQPHFQRCVPHGRQDIPTRGVGIHEGAVQIDLSEQVVDIHPRRVAARENGGLGGHRGRAADAGELAAVDLITEPVGGAQRRQQDRVPACRVGGKIAGVPVRPGAGAAAHEQCGNAFEISHSHSFSFDWSVP